MMKIFNKLLNKELNKYDLVIVSDYGHGMISKIVPILYVGNLNF